MHRTLAAQLPATAPGTRVRVEGWLHRRRTLASVTFLILRDRTGLAQVVLKDPAALARSAGLGEETVVSVEGTVVANPSAPSGVEILDPTVSPLSEPAEPPPVELWRPSLAAGLPTLLDNAPVTLRHPRSRAMWQLASAGMQGFRRALTAQGFTEIATPKIVGASTESGANVFTVDYFGEKAYLAQSPQLYKQTLVGVFERVFEVGPVFRAEPHDTVRHIAEYVSLDAELGFIEDHRDVLVVLRSALAGMLEAATELAPGALRTLGVDLPMVPDEIPVVHFEEALRLVGAPEDEPDLSPAHERALSVWARERYGSEFLAVEGYPMVKRPFYTHPDPVRPALIRQYLARADALGFHSAWVVEHTLGTMASLAPAGRATRIDPQVAPKLSVSLPWLTCLQIPSPTSAAQASPVDRCRRALWASTRPCCTDRRSPPPSARGCRAAAASISGSSEQMTRSASLSQ